MEQQAARPRINSEDRADALLQKGTDQHSQTNDAAAGALDKLQHDAQTALQHFGQMVPRAMDRLNRAHEAAHKAPEKPTPSKVDWLFCVDVTTKNFGAGNDIELQMGRLRELAKQTKGKPGVAIVAQTAVQDVEDAAMPLYSSFVSNPYHIDRYIIRDGNVSKIDTVNSRGYAGDVKNLLSFGTQHFTPAKIGLHIDSHGSGNEGLDADTGHANVKDFVAAVKDGLKGRAGQKLDVIDFDACLMAQNGVLERVQKVTDHVVASAETEGALGQEFTKAMERVVENPKITPSEFADLLVETARQQDVVVQPTREHARHQFDKKKNGRGDGDGTTEVPVQTLAHFDLTRYEQFRGNLDAFGNALTEAIKDPKNRRAVDDLIGDTVPYGQWNVKRDLKKFTEGVLDKIGDGSMSDPSGQVRLQAGRVLDSLKKFVVSYSGFDQFGSAGGLSAFVPSRGEVDFHAQARDWNHAYAFQKLASDAPLLPEKKAEYVKHLQEQLKQVQDWDLTRAKGHVSESTLKQATSAWHAADNAVKKFAHASGLSDTLHAMDEMKRTSRDLFNTKLFQQKLIEAEREEKRDLLGHYKEELVGADTGWGKFREALRRLD